MRPTSTLTFIFTGLLFMTASALAGKTTIQDRFNFFVPTDLTDARIEKLSDREKKLLIQLIHVGEAVDAAFLEQAHPMGQHWLTKLNELAQKDPKKYGPYVSYFKQSFSPFDIFSGEWFLPAEVTKEKWGELPGANLFPYAKNNYGVADTVSKDIVETWIKKNPQDEASFLNPFTAIVQEGDKLKAVPYSRQFKEAAERVANELEKVAALADDPKLKKLALSRAKAFRTNQFDETEKDWIDAHDSLFQLTVGPYEEVDGITGTKRGFQAQIAMKDIDTTKNIQVYLTYLDQFQKSLPSYEKYRGDTHKVTHMTAVNQVYLAGDARHGVLAMAEHLPNTRSVQQKVGSRKLFFMNVLNAKCENVLIPIGKVVLAPELAKYVSCDSNSKFTIHHEIAHGLGPSFYVDPKGKKKEINDVLGVWAGPLEEAKADSVGLLDRQYMFTNGLEKGEPLEMEMYATYTANFFRSVRFGAASPHRKGIVLQFNTLREVGAITFDKEGRVRFDVEKMRAHVRDMADLIIGLQLGGDPKKVEETFMTKGQISKEMQTLIDRVNKAGLPRDVFPSFPGAAALLASEVPAKS